MFIPTANLTNVNTGYSINYALALDGVADYLHWTPGGTGVSSTTWTFSLWFKQTRSDVNHQDCIISCGASNNATAISTYNTGGAFDNVLNVYAYHGSVDFEKQLVRHQSDAASWYHLVVQYDSTEGTDTNRIKLYINGVRYTDFETGTLGGTDSWPTLSEATDFGTTDTIKLGVNTTFGSPHAYFFLGEIAEVIMIDGAALDPTSFGEEDADGFWMPIEPSPANFPVTKITNAVPVMTGYTTPSGIVATDDDTNSPAWQAFDGVITSPGNYWYGSGTTPNFITYEFTSNETVVEYGIWPQTGYAGSRYPTAWTLEGWTGSAWEVLDTRSGETSWTDSVSNDYTVASPDSYIKYKLDITAYTGLAIVQEIELRTAAIVNMGTNGFWLDFAVAPGTGNGAGTDVSGNGNHFTDVSLTSASQIVSTPTDNYPTMNPLHAHSTAVFSENNLKITVPTPNYRTSYGTQLIPSTGKWGFKFNAEASLNFATDDAATGICTNDWAVSGNKSAQAGNSAVWIAQGAYNLQIYTGVTNATLVGSLSTNSGYDTEFLVNMDDMEITVLINGTSYGPYTIPAITAGQQFKVFHTAVGMFTQFDFGQNGYTPSDADYSTLSTTNLPEPTIKDPSKHFYSEVVTHDGTSTASTCSFNLDTYEWLCIIKNTTGAVEGWYFIDSLRGSNKYMENDTTVEVTDANVLTVSGTTFTLGSTLGAKDYLVEFHKAGLAADTASNTDGALNTTLTSANTVSGFSISLYTGTGSATTYGHGLNSAPEFGYTFDRANAGSNTRTYHKAMTSAAYRVLLDTTAVEASDSTVFNSTAPSSTVISIGTSGSINGSSHTFVSYYWHSVEGYSYFGEYTGNGNIDGPFVNLGFHPQSFLYKNIRTTTGYWNHWYYEMWPTNGGTTTVLEHNTTNAAQSITGADSLSNGWKVRNITGDGNTSGTPALVCAWGGSGKNENGK